MTKHTQGPWLKEYDNCDNGTGQWYNIGPAKVEVPYNITKQQHEEWLANVALVQAAPELLELLKKWQKFSQEGCSGNEWEALLIERNAVIAKAEGTA